MNTIQLVGRLGQDPETRTTHSDTTVCNLSLATNRSVKRGNEWEAVTDWHRIVCFGRTAENVAKYKKKGDEIAVEGVLTYSKWEDQSGNKRTTAEVVANRVHFVGGRGQRQEGQQQQTGGGPSGVDDDIPF